MSVEKITRQEDFEMQGADARATSLDLVQKYMDQDGRILLPTAGGYTLVVDPLNPTASEWYATKDGSVEGPRKINSAEMWQHPTDSSKSQVIMVENDRRNDGTVGEISPLLVETTEGVFVAVQNADRYDRQYVEAFRRGWTRPADEAPEVKKANDNFIVEKYTEKDLGLTVSNNARLVAPDGKKAIINDALTVIRSEDGSKPEISGASWMPVEDFLCFTEEGMGKGVVNAANTFGIIKVNSEKMRENRAKIADHVAAVKAELTS